MHAKPQTKVLASRKTAPSAALCRIPLVEDRGFLSYAESGIHFPFTVKRYFVVFGVPADATRANHAHRHQHQFLVCVHGSCRITADNGTARQEFVLDAADKGVHLPPMVWVSTHHFSPDAVLLVLSSDLYDPNEYLNDYDAFLELCRRES